MKNINKLVMQGKADGMSLAVVEEVFANLEDVANDLGRDIQVVAMMVNLAIFASNVSNAEHRYLLDIALGTQNAWNPLTNIFNWKLNSIAGVGGVSFQRDDSINQLIGNFKDVIFTIPKFTSQVTGGNAQKGQLFLNARLDNRFVTASFSPQIQFYITIYYI